MTRKPFEVSVRSGQRRHFMLWLDAGPLGCIADDPDGRLHQRRPGETFWPRVNVALQDWRFAGGCARQDFPSIIARADLSDLELLRSVYGWIRSSLFELTSNGPARAGSRTLAPLPGNELGRLCLVGACRLIAGFQDRAADYGELLAAARHHAAAAPGDVAVLAGALRESGVSSLIALGQQLKMKAAVEAATAPVPVALGQSARPRSAL